MTVPLLRHAPLAAGEANSAERAQEMVNAAENLRITRLFVRAGLSFAGAGRFLIGACAGFVL
ncbi:MAG TPA: hypothetical protein VL100_10980, partial [Croceibacterium sp.]|nr:hypothetical protein [Croceibacterium sp.]